MRTADPGDLTLTLKNPKLDGSSLAKRRKTKAESKPTNENFERVEDAGGALRVVRSEDSGVDVKEQQAASAADFVEDKEETAMSNKADNGEDKKDIENFEGEMRRSNEERKDASSQDSVESRTSSDSGQDFS